MCGTELVLTNMVAGCFCSQPSSLIDLVVSASGKTLGRSANLQRISALTQINEST